jgi:hypothetical protein
MIRAAPVEGCHWASPQAWMRAPPTWYPVDFALKMAPITWVLCSSRSEPAAAAAGATSAP